MYSSDVLYVSSVNRALKNAGGFTLCMRDYRYFVAALVLRGQLDTLCRIYGLQVAGSQVSYISAFMRGEIRSEKDKDGEKLTDRRLVEHLAKVLPWVASMYEALSGFAHLSNTHFHASFAAQGDEGEVAGLTSEWDTEVPIKTYGEACDGFAEVSSVLMELFVQYADQGSER